MSGNPFLQNEVFAWDEAKDPQRTNVTGCASGPLYCWLHISLVEYHEFSDGPTVSTS